METFQAAHTVSDNASIVGAEDLKNVIARRKSWECGFNRCMGFWSKGVLAETLTSVTKQRSANLVLGLRGIDGKRFFCKATPA